MVADERPADPLVGTEVEVEVGPIAHGGHTVARHDGRVLFVRHALPGERVRVRVSEGRVGDRFLRADAVAVLAAAPTRVEPPCRWAGECGGCDFQHVSLPGQRELKTAVVREQVARLAGLDWAGEVEEVPGTAASGLGWRTRVDYAVDARGRAGLRAHRSHEVVPIDTCLLATDAIRGSDVLTRTWSVPSVEVVDASLSGLRVVPVADRVDPGPIVHEAVGDAEFAVAARGFWQVHPGAADLFTTTVLELLDPQPGERALDLYAGVGLFARFLAEAVGPLGQVVAVESDRTACENARRNLAEHRQALVVDGRVDDLFGVARPKRRGAATQRASRGRRVRRSPLLPERCDLVVLDPPRTGAGADVVRAVAALRPRGIAYVACDPAALARDLATFAASGYRLERLRAFDAFPMTHHIECIALLTPHTG